MKIDHSLAPALIQHVRLISAEIATVMPNGLDSPTLEVYDKVNLIKDVKEISPAA